MAIQSNPINQNGAVISGSSTRTFFNITANTLVKATPGRVAKISVIVAGAAGSVHDAATIGAAGATNNLGVIPAVIGLYTFDMHVSNGIVVKPGAGQTLAISYI
jgi:hypothetical protein